MSNCLLRLQKVDNAIKKKQCMQVMHPVYSIIYNQPGFASTYQKDSTKMPIIIGWHPESQSNLLNSKFIFKFNETSKLRKIRMN